MSNIDINKKQILVLTPRFPFPVIGGDRLRIYKICKELSKHYDLTLLSLCDKREELNYEYDREVFSSVHRVYLSKKKSILNVIFSLFSNTPLQIGYYKSKEFEDKLKQLLPEHSATLSHLIRVGDYVKENKDINFLEMTDAISLNYKRVKEKASLLSLKTFVYSFEQKRLERYERTINNKFSLTTLVSQVDSDYLYPDRPNNVLVCGNGVDAVSLPFSERKIAKDKKITLVFIGNLYSLQNMDGVRWFTKEVLPFLNKHGNFEFKVIGRITDKDKSWLESQPGVVEPHLSPIPLISVRETNEVALAVRKYAKEIGIPIITDKKLARKIYATHRRYDYVSFENIDEILRLLLWLEDVENAGQPVPDEQFSSEDKFIEGEDTEIENKDNN
ncbi:EscU/YscU/HrcU family type III secretion system export apparatus switch protein [Escherichia coli]|nr:EscU/YscU/HrcU family type III secretion system export apparatus switch protein [Escherichia coli]